MKTLVMPYILRRFTSDLCCKEYDDSGDYTPVGLRGSECLDAPESLPTGCTQAPKASHSFDAIAPVVFVR